MDEEEKPPESIAELFRRLEERVQRGEVATAEDEEPAAPRASPSKMTPPRADLRLPYKERED